MPIQNILDQGMNILSGSPKDLESTTTGTTGSVTVTETVPQKPNILIIQLEEAIEKLGKIDPELKEKL